MQSLIQASLWMRSYLPPPPGKFIGKIILHHKKKTLERERETVQLLLALLYFNSYGKIGYRGIQC